MIKLISMFNIDFKLEYYKNILTNDEKNFVNFVN